MSDAAAGATGGAGIGGAIGGPVGAGIGAGIGAIGGGIIDFFGQQSANDQNWNEFVSNQTWNTAEIANAQNLDQYLSNTSFQRGTADARAAGINPMALGTSGGASTPSMPVTNAGTGAAIQNPTAGLARAIGSAVPDALTAANTMTDIKNTNQDTMLKGLQGLKAAADTSYANTATDKAAEDLYQLQARRDQNQAEANRATSQATLDKSWQKVQKIMDLVGQGVGTITNATSGAAGLNSIIQSLKKPPMKPQIGIGAP